MGRKIDPESYYNSSETVYNFFIKQELKDFINIEIKKSVKKFRRSKKIDRGNGHPDDISANLKDLTSEIIQKIESSKNLNEFLFWISNKRHYPIFRLDDANYFEEYEYERYIDELSYFRFSYDNLKNSDPNLILDGYDFQSVLDHELNLIATKTERLSYLFFFKRRIKKFLVAEKTRENKEVEIRISRKKSISIYSHIDWSSIDLILNERMRSERIRLPYLTTSAESPDAVFRKLISLFKLLENEDIIAFDPLRDFIRSEFIITRDDVLRPTKHFSIYVGKHCKPRIIVLSLMSLQPQSINQLKSARNLKMTRDRLMDHIDKQNLFDLDKIAFKYWLLNLNIPSVTHSIIESCFNKPILREDRKFILNLLYKLENIK